MKTKAVFKPSPTQSNRTTDHPALAKAASGSRLSSLVQVPEQHQVTVGVVAATTTRTPTAHATSHEATCISS